jgi:hypothetical protein
MLLAPGRNLNYLQMLNTCNGKALPVEQLLNCIEPALVFASDRMIDLVDRVIERNVHDDERNQRINVLAWLCGVGHPVSLNHRIGA